MTGNEPSPAPELASLLHALGLPREEIDQAPDEASLMLLAVERLALGQELRYDLAEVSGLTGLDEQDLRHMWRSLGYPDPVPGDLLFSEIDVANMRGVADLLSSGAVDHEVVFGMTRVMGSSMARVAQAVVDAISAKAQAATLDDSAESVGYRAGGFLTTMPHILEQVFRRHLQEAARRRLLRGEGDEAHGLVVGFADLVGFTAIAQQVSDQELSELVDEFERLAYDVVVMGGGRVVKMIGDEVMFLVEDPVAAAEIALGLSDASRDAAGLSDVRVGLAMGPVLEREGDAYGATVNLASRATGIAYPGTVVVGPTVRAALEDHPEFSFRVMRPRTLKNIGRVSLAVLRRVEESPSTIREAIEERRRQMRDRVRDRVKDLVLPDQDAGLDDA